MRHPLSGRIFVLLSLSLVVMSGCSEFYFLFGPGGIWGPESANSRTSAGTTTQPVAIAGPAFSVRQLDPVLESTAGARVIVAADFNGDGLVDFASGSAESQPIQLHLRVPGTSDYNTFSIAGEVPISIMYDLQVADFDQDGRLDVAVLVNNTGIIPVAGATKRGAVVLLFAPPDPADSIAWQQVVIDATFVLPNDDEGLTDFAVGDMDGQNGADIVLGSNEVASGGNTATKRVYLFQNPGGANARNGAAWLGPDFAATFPILSDAPPFKQLDLADIDGDGDLDVVATYPTALSSNIRWLINPLVEAGAGAVAAGGWQGNIIGEQRQLNQPGDEQVPGADYIAVGDIDGDGDVDVVSVFEQLRLVQWFENPGPGFVRLQGFPWRVYNIGQLNAGVSINQVQLVDLNLDGRLDCFVTASGSMVAFQPRADVQNYWQPISLLATNPVATIGRCAFVDENGNGLIDIIAPMDRDGVTQDQFLILNRLTP